MLGFDPLSAFGRGLMGLFADKAAPFALVMALPLALIAIIAFFRGRAFCNWCPVGFSLGLFSALAPLGMKISPACVSSGICEQKCPARCMNSREKRLDAGRCVLCFSCAAACPSNSAYYGLRGLKTARLNRAVCS
ncbi:MAG: 4Fe-4S binding protein [Treponema sp.]|jgi:polyferredoxin|nr:4Fe-4S binding protein [Treponema sp.]